MGSRMVYIKSFILSVLFLFSIHAWGAGELPAPPEPEFSADNEIFGRVFLRYPWKGAFVTIIDNSGSVIAESKTDDNGSYRVVLDVKKNPPFIVRAALSNGKEAFGIGNEHSVNVTRLSDLILRKWYGKSGGLSALFHNNAIVGIPDVNDIQVALGQFFTEINQYISRVDYDVLSGVIDSDVEVVLRSVRIGKNGSIVKIRDRNNVSNTFVLSYSRVNDGNSLVISGSNSVKESKPSGQKLRLKARFTAPFFAKIDPYLSSNIASAFADKTKSHDWMSQDAAYINDKLLAEVAIPGTHDSGTAGIGGDTGHTVAATQDKSIHEQLEDGIRYFDLRADENSGKACADGSDYYVFHGDGTTRYLSYRFHDVLLGVKNFLDDPRHSKEIIIIDMQQISAGNAGSEAVFFREVQEMLHPYLMDNRIPSYQWWKVPIGQIWKYNNVNNVRGQVILLASGGWFLPPRSGCQAQMEKNLWLPREDLLNGYWRSGRRDFNPIFDDIKAQLSMGSAIKQDRLDLFRNYRRYRENGGLNVLNLAPQPSDADYASWVIEAQFTSKTRDYLQFYSNSKVNYLANITLPKSNSDNGCWSASLGKAYIRSNMSYFAGSSGSRNVWNPVNIIMVDAYDRSDFWASVDYDSVGRFKWLSATNFVPFVRRLNYVERTPSGAKLVEQWSLEDNDIYQCFK